MPFDGLRNATLAERLTWMGITPVPDDVLERHKAAEVAKHPDRADQARVALTVVAVLSGAAGGVLVGIDLSGHMGVLAIPFGFLITGWLTVVTLAMLVLSFQHVKLKGPAKWVERHHDRQFIPDPIWQVTREAFRHVPCSHLIIGELIQDRVLLDPYLILCVGSERACLGIWDGETVIAIATRTEGDV
jgi:hypothetical protein